MNYKKMVEDINKIVNDNWHADLEMRHADNQPFTQEEAQEMEKRLGQIYMISHGITCKACGRLYSTI